MENESDIHKTHNQLLMLFSKVCISILLFSFSFIFGFLPLQLTSLKKNVKMIGVANAFSGGIFLSVALLHLLPESTEAFNQYFKDNNEEDKKSKHSHFPISFLLAFCGYTVILLVEKILFNSHTIEENEIIYFDNKELLTCDNIHEANLMTNDAQLLTNTQNNGLNPPETNLIVNNNQNQLSTTLPCTVSGAEYNNNKLGLQYFQLYKSQILNPSSKKNSINDPAKWSQLYMSQLLNHNSKANSINEPVAKLTHVSKKNSMNFQKKEKEDLISMGKKKDIDKEERKFKESFSNLGKLSKAAKIKFLPKKELLSARNSRLSLDIKNDLSVPLKEYSSTSKNITSYLLILALSIHASFEGIALGLQDKNRDLYYMLLAISFHKWVEALSIGIHLNKSKIDRETILKLIVCFSLMTPLGCLLGILLSGISVMLEATFLSISAGSFIYISASEIIIEEFSVSKYKLEKFLAFLLGAIIICMLTLSEYLN